MFWHMVAEYLLFLAKSVTLVLAVVAVLLSLSVFGRKARPAGVLELKDLNDKFRDYQMQMQMQVLPHKAMKALLKQEKKAEEEKEKAQEKAMKIQQQQSKSASESGIADPVDPTDKRVYVLKFDGDIKASAVEALREEITAILQIVRPEADRVVLCLESPGGVVHGYGLAASQLRRLRQAKVSLDICVDKVAASGGYLMAALADRIIAAPFAIVGSIGVVAQLPNFNRLLKKYDIDIELHTAGAYKRTLTMLGENTEAGRQKFREELEETHLLFKQWVKEARPALDIEQVATGEHWYGQTALALRLIDEIATSDDHLGQLAKEASLYEVTYHLPEPFLQRLSHSLMHALESTLLRLLGSVRFIA